MKKLILVFFIFAFFASSLPILAQEKTEINFFYSETCPHCKEEKKFLDELKERYPEIVINQYEITKNTQNQELLKDFYERYQTPEKDRGWVPVTFTHKDYFIGFNSKTANDIENCLIECISGEDREETQTIKIPLFGEINLANFSLPTITLIIGALDGFNPCAMWVLVFLLALLINTGSRKKMWLVGGIFVAVSGIIYFLILSAWLNLFLAISYINLTRIIIGLFALGIGVWQIKNFITYNPGVCKVIGLKSRLENKLKEKAEEIVSAPFILSAVVGVVVLAFGVNLIEFFCSAGLPAIYTRILALSELNSLTYYLYLLLYTFIFMLDDFIIFSIAIITLKRFGGAEKYNYWMTLIGGILILVLGILLIFKPEILMFA